MHFLDEVSSRIAEERKRFGLSQEIFGMELGVSKRTQAGYEGGASAPDAVYLIKAAQMGVDVEYVLFGRRSESHLSPAEQEFLNLFRSSPPMLRAAARGAMRAGLETGSSSPPAMVANTITNSQVNTGQVNNTASKMKFGK